MTVAIILAGGLGTRLRSVVSDRPKAMALVGGCPFLEFLIRYWSTRGIRRFVLAVGYMSSSIISHFGREYAGCQIDYSMEDRPLGTGGALLRAVQALIHEPTVLVLNGDTFFEVDRLRMAEQISTGADGVFALFPSRDSNRYLPVAVDESLRLLSFAKVESLGPQFYVNGGCYLFRTSMFDEFDKAFTPPYSLEADLFPMMLEQRFNLRAELFDSTFLDIGVPNDYERATDILMPYFPNRDREKSCY